MRPETKKALLEELSDRGIHLETGVDPKDATVRDVVDAFKKVAAKKKVHAERIFEDVNMDDSDDDCDCSGAGGKKGKNKGGEHYCCSVFGRTVWLGLLTALGTAMVVVGVDKKDDCPAEKMVPIFLIVDGAAILADVLLQFLGSLMMCRAICRGKDVKKTFLYTGPVKFLRGLLGFFMFVWFIVGSVYVFKIFEPSYNLGVEGSEVSSLADYCHESTYKFAFSVLILGYIFLALSIVLTVCGCCVAGCCACALAAGTLAGGIAGGLTGGLASQHMGNGRCRGGNCNGDDDDDAPQKLEAVEVA